MNDKTFAKLSISEMLLLGYSHDMKLSPRLRSTCWPSVSVIGQRAESQGAFLTPVAGDPRFSANGFSAIPSAHTQSDGTPTLSAEDPRGAEIEVPPTHNFSAEVERSIRQAGGYIV